MRSSCVCKRFPFRERDLDASVEDFIVGWARELRPKEPLRIVVHLPNAEATAKLEEAFHHYFTYRAEVLNGEFKELLRVGRLSLIVDSCHLSGGVALGQCLFGGYSLRHLARTELSDSWLGRELAAARDFSL
jgi:hypothetical protein